MPLLQSKDRLLRKDVNGIFKLVPSEICSLSALFSRHIDPSTNHLTFWNGYKVFLFVLYFFYLILTFLKVHLALMCSCVISRWKFPYDLFSKKTTVHWESRDHWVATVWWLLSRHQKKRPESKWSPTPTTLWALLP